MKEFFFFLLFHIWYNSTPTIWQHVVLPWARIHSSRLGEINCTVTSYNHLSWFLYSEFNKKKLQWELRSPQRCSSATADNFPPRVCYLFSYRISNRSGRRLAISCPCPRRDTVKWSAPSKPPRCSWCRKEVLQPALGNAREQQHCWGWHSTEHNAWPRVGSSRSRSNRTAKVRSISKDAPRTLLFGVELHPVPLPVPARALHTEHAHGTPVWSCAYKTLSAPVLWRLRLIPVARKWSDIRISKSEPPKFWQRGIRVRLKTLKSFLKDNLTCITIHFLIHL